MIKIRFMKWGGWSRWYTCQSYMIRHDCLQMYGVQHETAGELDYEMIAVPLHYVRGEIQVVS